jgi:hypothetical protein
MLNNKKQTELKLYYIQNGWVGNAILWWAIDSKGYTTDLRNAGKYTHEQAQGIIKRPQDIAWECDYVDNCLDAHKLVVDGNYLDSKKCLEGIRR